LGYTSEELPDTFWVDHIYHEDKDYKGNFVQTKASLDHDFNTAWFEKWRYCLA
jgi:hypothetical protein